MSSIARNNRAAAASVTASVSDNSPSTMHCAPPFRSVDVTFTAGSSNNTKSSSQGPGKMRIREAYARALDERTSTQPPSPLWYIIPDAAAWRIYGPWITQVVSYMTKQQQEQEATGMTKDTIPKPSVQWILLESVAEDLELRQQYHPALGKGEVALPQERVRLTRLIKQQQQQEASSIVRSFCDLSFRDVDFDEWQDLSLLSNRSQRMALWALRAARLLRLSSYNNIIGRNNKNGIDGLELPRIGLWWQDDGQKDLQKDIQQQQEHEEEGVEWVEPNTILQILKDQCGVLFTEAQLQELDKIRLQCPRDYQQRQHQQSSSSSLTSANVHTWTGEQLEEGVRNGTLGRGRYQVSKENPSEAFCSMKGTMWFVPATSVRAIDQDMVIIQPLPTSEWQQPVGRRRIVAVSTTNTNKSDDDDDDDAETASTAVSTTATGGTTVPTARLVRVDQIGPRRVVVATLTDEPTLSDEGVIFVVPMDIRIPKIRIQSKEWRKWWGQRLLVHIYAWDPEARYPAGHVREILGPVGNLETEMTSLLHEHRISLEPWSLASQACLPKADWTISADEIKSRRDLRRTHNIFSVDPVGCQDIDDCMHARRLPNGGIEVGVHIADVTYFVPLNSPLDLQARQRGTTFYLVDRRFDMLPSVLSSNLCSLHGGTDRLAVSVIWTLTEDMSEILSTWYGRTVIHNVAAMTYDQADRILLGESPEAPGEELPPPLTAGAVVDRSLIPKLREHLGILTRLARQRRQERKDYGGAVDLSSGDTGSELKFTLVNGEPVRVQPKQTKEIHRTIEEMMIWANTSVASEIKRRYPDSALLRIHRAVEEERFDDLKDLLAAGDISFKGKTNAELAESLQRAQERSNKTVASLFRSLATRAMSEALYVSTGSIDSSDRLAHYGLGLKEYTHFTSPIRRYADVVVHHQLLSALQAPESREDTKYPNRKPAFDRLPDSNVMSVLNDELVNLSTDDDDLEIDQLIGDAGVELIQEMRWVSNSRNQDNQLIQLSNGPFSSGEVSSICTHLNDHNRMAKQSSMDCQGLFLSLYFRKHVECTHAVVTDLRENGFYCYVPKFDLRGPVFLRDVDGNVQVDPALFGLSRTAGSEPSRGFTSSGLVRRFEPSESEILFKENEVLEVFVRVRSIALRPLDVVMVSITCPDLDNRARVPLPRIQLIHHKMEKVNVDNSGRGVTSSQLKRSGAGIESSLSKDSGFSTTSAADTPSLFELFEKLPHLALSEHLGPVNSLGPTRKTVPGRLMWGGFVNPDTRAAAQAAAQEAVAALRGERAIAREVNEYDVNNRVAREVTSRQQRLAAEKRNARRAKRN